MAKDFRISRAVADKLRHKHGVTHVEVLECFMNRDGPLLVDTRSDHKTDPPTMWFVSTTDTGRVLKIVYIEHADFFAIKTAFPPNDGSDAMYEKLRAKYAKSK